MFASIHSTFHKMLLLWLKCILSKYDYHFMKCLLSAVVHLLMQMGAGMTARVITRYYASFLLPRAVLPRVSPDSSLQIMRLTDQNKHRYRTQVDKTKQQVGLEPEDLKEQGRQLAIFGKTFGYCCGGCGWLGQTMSHNTAFSPAFCICISFFFFLSLFFPLFSALLYTDAVGHCLCKGIRR